MASKRIYLCLSNICAGIGRGQMTFVNEHIAHHKHIQALYEELLKDVKGITVHSQPQSPISHQHSIATIGFALLHMILT